MLNGLLFVPESQRRAFWSKCLLPAFPFFLFFFWRLKCQQMRNNLYHLVSVVISNGWKGHNTADHTGEQWTPHTSPSSLSTFSRVLIGPKRGERKKSFRDFTWAVSCSLARLARFYSRWTTGLMEAPTAGSDRVTFGQDERGEMPSLDPE